MFAASSSCVSQPSVARQPGRSPLPQPSPPVPPVPDFPRSRHFAPPSAENLGMKVFRKPPCSSTRDRPHRARHRGCPSTEERGDKAKRLVASFDSLRAGPTRHERDVRCLEL